MSQGRRRAAAGLTLIEFLFATSIMAFVALGVAGMFPAALRSIVKGGQVTKATALAQEMAEMIRAEAAQLTGFTKLITNYNGQNTAAITYNCATGTVSTRTPLQKWKCDIAATSAQDSGSGLPEGYGTVAVTCVDASGGVVTGTCSTNLRRLTVSVTWERGGSRTISVVTNVARPQ